VRYGRFVDEEHDEDHEEMAAAISGLNVRAPARQKDPPLCAVAALVRVFRRSLQSARAFGQGTNLPAVTVQT